MVHSNLLLVTAFLDYATIVDHLDPGAIRERLSELDRQSRALRVLLRAALAHQRSQPSRGNPPAEAREVPRAS